MSVRTITLAMAVALSASAAMAAERVGSTVSAMTGHSDKRAYRIITPQGTIGVRGTVFDMSVRNGKTRILLLPNNH